MTRFLELLMSAVIVAILFVVVGVFLPDRRSVQHSVETSHPLRQAFDTLNSFKRFAEWNPLRQHDPRVAYTLSGPVEGVGAQIDYVSALPEIGKGSWHLTESELDSHVRHTVYNDKYGQNKNYLMTFRQKGKIVELDWKYSVDYGWSLPGRYAGLYVDRTVGDDMKRALANIANLLASMPNFDYRNLDVQDTVIAPMNVLYISTTADRNITAVENAMDVALKDIRAAIAANRLVEAEKPRLITTSFGTDKYEFDVAIPVARASDRVVEDEGEGAEVPSSSNGDATAMAATAQVDLTPPAPLEDLRLPDNVRQGHSYAGRVLMAAYRGHPAALPLIRDQLRSYAASHGENLHDRAFEEYLSEIAETAAEDAQFRVFWPIH
jgi:hypothetical protein